MRDERRRRRLAVRAGDGDVPSSPGKKRSAISTSLTIGTPAFRAALSGGASGGTPGLSTTSAARAMRWRSWPPVCTSAPFAQQLRGVDVDLRRSPRHPTRKPGRPCAKQLGDGASASGDADDRDLAGPPFRPRPRQPRPTAHRIWSVLRAMNANRTPMIQKRTTTCASSHPFTSK